jgi:hypothetical protein
MLREDANNTPRVASICARSETSEIRRSQFRRRYGSPFITSMPNTSSRRRAFHRFRAGVYLELQTELQGDDQLHQQRTTKWAARWTWRSEEPCRASTTTWRAGKGRSQGLRQVLFLTSYNSEQAYGRNSDQRLKRPTDFIAAVSAGNRARTCAKSGTWHRALDTRSTCTTALDGSQRADLKKGVKILTPPSCGLDLRSPTHPESPHGSASIPRAEYIVAKQKLATVIPLHSFYQDPEGHRRQGRLQTNSRQSGAQSTGESGR